MDAALSPLTKKGAKRKHIPYQRKRVRQSHKYKTHTSQWFIKYSKKGKPLNKRRSSDSE